MPRPSLSPQLAEENAESVSRLYVGLRDAAAQAGVQVADVAEVMAIDEDTVRSVLAGRLDLSLSDLQEVALAVDALVTFRVTPSAGSLLGSSGVSDAAARIARDQWDQSLNAEGVTKIAMERTLQRLNV